MRKFSVAIAVRRYFTVILHSREGGGTSLLLRWLKVLFEDILAFVKSYPTVNVLWAPSKYWFQVIPLLLHRKSIIELLYCTHATVLFTLLCGLMLLNECLYAL